MRARSITGQVLSVVLIAQILFAMLVGVAAVLGERHTRLLALQQQVSGRSDSLLGAIQDAEDPEDNITLDPAELRLPAEDRYAVYSASGKLIGRSEDAEPPLPKDGVEGMSTLRLQGVAYRVLRRSVLRIIDREENGGKGFRRPAVIVYAAPTSHVLHEVTEAVGRLLVILLLASVCVVGVTAFLLQKTLQPIRALALAAQQITPSSLHFTTPPGAVRVDELRPLAATLSHLIDELREAFGKQQRFVGDAAHELKTAVAVVRSSIQVLLLKPRSEAEYVSGLETVLEDNDRVEALVASMLELARLEQSRPEQTSSIDLGIAAEEACASMLSTAETAGISLDVAAAHGTTVALPADRARTLIHNLLTNAIRHSRPGSSVRVLVQRRSNTVALAVEDAGDGIRPEALPYVFERFYRDDPSRSRMSGGTGLGLAICRSIVDAAGGRITLTSAVGEGTRVMVIFSAV